jgi:hypothetical protein
MSVPGGDVIAQRADALAALVEARLPLDMDVPYGGDAWPLAGAALIAHATGTLRSIVLLSAAGAHNDAFRLLRSLYDHAVTFAWLAAQPTGERLEAWRLEDLAARLKMDREAAAAGISLLDDATREQMARDVADAKAKTPDLASKAAAVDRYWAPRVEAIDDEFRRLYTLLFRTHSGLVHATFRGLNHVTEVVSSTRTRVLVQLPPDGRGATGMATVVYGLALLVAAQALGWPSTADVHAVFDLYETG